MADSSTPRLMFAQKRPAVWKCSVCGERFPLLPIEQSHGEDKPAVVERKIEAIELLFEKHVQAKHL
jgi:hypothetical protein